MSRYTYPHSFDNGSGEFLAFTRRIATPTGDRLEGYNIVKPGNGPPMHLHHYQEEIFTVEEGKLGYQVYGGPEKFAAPGETVAFPAGVAHRFWNAGNTDLRCSASLEPADNIEFFLGALFDSTKRSGNGRPSLFDIAWLTTRYKTEYEMKVIPPLIQLLLFPFVIAIGNALGKYARYADAPSPIRR